MSRGESNPQTWRLSDRQRQQFQERGWLHLPGFLSEAELAELDAIYTRFLQREVFVEGRDFCDMSADYDAPVESFAVVNIMLPSRYLPSLQGNVYERRAREVAEQLIGPGLAFDYDQLVAKPPRQSEAVFEWHQDLAYWPKTEDPRTASFWLALDQVDLENGCVQFVDGSHREPELRAHQPLHGDRDKSHSLVAQVDPAVDRITPALLAPGDVTVHHERTVHGSQGNPSARWRRGWVIAFRSKATVAAERAMGFTHSHNDSLEVLDRVGDRGDEPV